MMLSTPANTPILLVGSGMLLESVAACLVNAGHYLKVFPSDSTAFNEGYQQHLAARNKNNSPGTAGSLKLLSEFHHDESISLVIAILPEDLALKLEKLEEIESFVSENTIIAINTETYGLDELQKSLNHKDRLIGLNWAEPAHTTLFLEIICSEENRPLAEKVKILANSWAKDPYIVTNSGVRSLMIGAMAREASFLVDNDYASYEDIDRACRNDTGYYLPFAGNCRYMDLMGTYAYGMVMKDLNPELSKDKNLPVFFDEISKMGRLGMENGSGFYDYDDDEVKKWKETMEKFSYKIKEIIDKYPFNYTVDSL